MSRVRRDGDSVGVVMQLLRRDRQGLATPRAEGWLAGFLGQDRDGNPYLRGFARLWPSQLVIEWDEGYDEGAAIRRL